MSQQIASQQEMFGDEDKTARCAHCGMKDVPTCLVPKFCPMKMPILVDETPLPDQKEEENLSIFDEQTVD